MERKENGRRLLDSLLSRRASVQFSLIGAEGTLRAEEKGPGIRLLSRLKLPFEELLMMEAGIEPF